MEYGKTRRGGVGLFCYNLFIGRETFPPCGGVLCRECYRESQYNPYPMLQGVELELEDVEIDLLQEGKDQERYRSARNGGHLMKVPFEYVLCHFRNMNR